MGHQSCILGGGIVQGKVDECYRCDEMIHHHMEIKGFDKYRSGIKSMMSLFF
jgi:hypothetical protein